MKTADHLTAMGDLTLGRDEIVLHPNDGYDLGLLAMSNRMRIYAGTDDEDFLAGNGNCMEGTVHLKNECSLATVRMNLSRWKELGKPRHVRLTCHEDKLLIGLP